MLWLFTDRARLADPLPAIAGLPKGQCGVVFRHEGVAGRAALAMAVAKLCRARRLALTVAGDWRLAASLGAGVHLRGGRGRAARGKLNTASAHDVAELRRGCWAGALVFVSPAFPTASHPGLAALGAWRWGLLARGAQVAALGGVAGNSVRRLPANCVAAGAISAFGDDPTTRRHFSKTT